MAHGSVRKPSFGERIADWRIRRESRLRRKRAAQAGGDALKPAAVKTDLLLKDLHPEFNQTGRGSMPAKEMGRAREALGGALAPGVLEKKPARAFGL